MVRKFKNPVFVTRPILADPKKVYQGILDIWRSKQLTNTGAQHKKLNQLLLPYFDNQAVVLFNNGTIALLLLLKALKLSGEVITTPFTFPATTHALTWNNLTPVFCDIENDSMNIDADKIEKLITPKTSAILAVHVFGMPCNVKKIEAIAKKHKLKVVYDAAHAFGVEIDGKSIANFGDASMFSFHATKLFHTIEGGAVVSKDRRLIEQLNIEKNFGISSPEHIKSAGLNGKMNEIQAMIGIETLKLINQEVKTRKKIKAIYIDKLKAVEGISFYTKPKNIKDNYQYFVIRINKKLFGLSRDDVFKRLIKFNIYPSKYFYPLTSTYPHYKNLKNSNIKNTPIAKQASSEVLALPFYGGLSKDDVLNICEALINLKNI